MPEPIPFTDPEQEAERQRNAAGAKVADQALRAFADELGRRLKDSLRETGNPDEAGYRAFAAMTSPADRG